MSSTTLPERSFWHALRSRAGRQALIGVPYLWLVVMTAIPALIILQFSISQLDVATLTRPWAMTDGVLNIKVDFNKYVFLFTDSLYIAAYLSSLKYAVINTVLCLVIGYPFAYFLARAPEAVRPSLLMAVMLPFWTSFLIRIYSWKGLLANNGVFNNILLSMGVVHEPLQMLNTPFSLSLGMVYTYLPFMILPLYTNLQKLDGRLLEAAMDLGATPWQAFWRITVPLSVNGIVAGSMLVFIPSIGEYVIPELLGGPETLMIGRVLWDEFFGNNDWAMASAVAAVMILLILGPMAIFNKYQHRKAPGAK